MVDFNFFTIEINEYKLLNKFHSFFLNRRIECKLNMIIISTYNLFFLQK